MERKEDSDNQFFKIRHGIKFTGNHPLLGMDILVGFGAFQAFPGHVYTGSKEELTQAFSLLRRYKVKFELNDNIPYFLTLDEARHLAEREGWQELILSSQREEGG